jgi:hypothetical protein
LPFPRTGRALLRAGPQYFSVAALASSAPLHAYLSPKIVRSADDQAEIVRQTDDRGEIVRRPDDL